MSGVGDAAQTGEAIISLALFVVLIYILIEAAEAAPFLDFQTQLDDQAEDLAGRWM